MFFQCSFLPIIGVFLLVMFSLFILSLKKTDNKLYEEKIEHNAYWDKWWSEVFDDIELEA